MMLRAALLSTFLIGLAGAQSVPAKTLRGLHKIRVLVAVDSQADQAGLSADRLQDDLTAKVKEAGVEAADTDEVKENLYLDVAAHPHGAGAYEVLLQLELHQPSILKRDASITINAITWKAVRFLSVSDNAAERIETAAQEMGGEFVKAWKSAQ